MSLILRSSGKLLAQKRRYANVLQSDGVQHAGGGLEKSRRRIAGHRLARESFYDKPTQALEGHDVFKFDSVAKRAAGGEDWDSSARYPPPTRSCRARIWEQASWAARGALRPRSRRRGCGYVTSRADRLRQHVPGRIGRLVDAEQDGQGRRQVDRLDLVAIDTRA